MIHLKRMEDICILEQLAAGIGRDKLSLKTYSKIKHYLVLEKHLLMTTTAFLVSKIITIDKKYVIYRRIHLDKIENIYNFLLLTKFWSTASTLLLLFLFCCTNTLTFLSSGYSTTVGEFTGDNDFDVAVGMPKGSNLTGKVQIINMRIALQYSRSRL